MPFSSHCKHWFILEHPREGIEDVDVTPLVINDTFKQQMLHLYKTSAAIAMKTTND